MADGVRRRGYRVLTERTSENGAGIISFRRDDIDSRVVVSELRQPGFEPAPRQGWVRVFLISILIQPNSTV